jgi:hypothetical protein
MNTIKVLIVSRTPWNNSNSFGNTFSNLFGGMSGVKIYNICCQPGSIENDIVKDTLQITESSLFNILLRRHKTANKEGSHESEALQQIQGYGKKQRSTWMFIVRDLIWRVSSRVWKKEIRDFANKVKPDILYFPLYPSWYMCNIDKYLIKIISRPVVFHISDDDYGYPPQISSLSLPYFYRSILRCKIRSLVQRASYLEVFAENMKVAYEKEFGVPCYVIGKGVKLEDIEKGNNHVCGDVVHFVYTGGVAGERMKVLLELGRSLSKNNDKKKCILDIYSATPLSKEAKFELESVESISFHGAISGTEVKGVQQKADCLVHVEGFSEKAVFEAGMSFSTKIIDYMATGNILLAIGHKDINSIQVLKKYKIAIVVDELKDLDSTVDCLLNEKTDIQTIKENAYKYLVNERDIEVIQHGVFERMIKVLCNRA